MGLQLLRSWSQESTRSLLGVCWDFAGSLLGVNWESAGILLGVCWGSAGSQLRVGVSLES